MAIKTGNDPLIHHYPEWIANAKESIRWIQSGERNAFCMKRGWEIPSRIKDEKDIEEYTRKIGYYMAKLGEAARSEM